MFVLLCVFYSSSISKASYICSDTNCLPRLQSGDLVLDCTAKQITIKDVCKCVQVQNISVLLAGENNIGRLKGTMLNGCENLKELDLHYNQLVEIDDQVFKKFTSLKILDLRANNLDIYKGDAPLSYILPKTVSVFRLGGNYKYGKHNFVYPNISQLHYLTDIYLDGLPAEFGNEYQNIVLLSLTAKTRFTYCNMTSVTDKTFLNLVNVERLDLSLCNISSISAGAFKNLGHLAYLDLSFNIRLGFDPLGVFSYGLQFTNITSLDYSYVYPTFGPGTELKIEHICYLSNTSLKEIFLNGNRLRAVETNALILLPKTLEKVYADENEPSFGPYLAQLGCASNLKFFRGNYQNQYHNPFQYIVDADLYGYERESTTFISSCKSMTEENLRKVASTSENCPFIGRKDYQKMLEPILPARLKHAEFRKISMSYSLDVRMFLKPHDNSLEYLDLSSNGLYSLLGPIGPLPNVKTVILSDNTCEYIGPNLFDETPKLEFLDLSKNYLSSFFTTETSKVVFLRLKHLKDLRLSQNKITSLFSETFTPLVMLTNLFLDQNSLISLELTFGKSKHLFF